LPVLSILGPTASGKSALALLLAQELDGEIISCDSMQVYRGMDIGTAKPTMAEQRLIKHHLIDILDIHVRYSASAFVEQVTPLVLEVESRGKVPILAGGSGMYARLFLYGSNMPPADRQVFAALKVRLEQEGRDVLWQELALIDPYTAEIVKDNDRRLLRALEAVLLTGAPLPGKTTWGDEATIPGLQVINLCSAELNRQRISERTVVMLKEGWIEETEKLIQQGLWETPTAAQSLGYRQIGDYLEGSMTYEELEEKIITLTHRYAKRQRTWFRNQHPGSLVINRDEERSSEKLAQKIGELYRKSFNL
jgi:tRNA dimethylallyltransferase